jgi:hypothetical protein
MINRMQQTGLNIIAVSIFAMTLSILLGPIFNISPLIPTLTTVAVMGFVTIDTFTWQNQGTNIILGFFASAQERERVLYHEAGHFLTAYLLKIPVTGYTLSAWEAWKAKQLGAGGVMFQPDLLTKKSQNLREFSLMLDRFSIVLMAGIAAENVIYGNNQGGDEDKQKLAQALISLGWNQNLYQQKQRWAILQATNLIEQNESSYQALVKAMKARKSVQECHQILEPIVRGMGKDNG